MYSGVSSFWRRVNVLALAMCVSMSVTGCVLVPFIRAFKEVGATEGDRMALLNDEVKKFNAAVVWGKNMEAMSFVAPESQVKLAPQFSESNEDERIVDSKVASVKWEDSARLAKVSVKVKFYRVPVYVVNTRTEEQQWTFHVGEGWKITDRSVSEG